MLRTKSRAGGLLAAAVVVAGLLGGGNALARASDTTAVGHQMTTRDKVSANQITDALGGSGTAGIAPAEKKAITEAEQAGLTGDINFSVPSGTFQGQVSVQLSTAIAGAQIRYTVNGTVPTAASTLYSTALNFTATTQLRAQPFVNGAANGAMGTSMYIARSINATHDLPVLVMDDYGKGKPDKTTDKDVAIMLMERPAGGTASLAQTPTVATRGGFHVRGQSSSNFAKTPYKLELWNNENKDAKYPMAGMPADGDWILRGPFPDKTLMRDALAYGLARDLGIQAPRYAFVEVYLNLDNNPLSADDYQGVYMLDEKIEISADRLNIPKLAATDLTEPGISGSYLMKFNMMAAEAPLVPCVPPTASYPCWSDLELTEPSDATPAQVSWIGNYILKVQDAMRSTTPGNAQTGYPAYIDVDSWMNRLIIEELGKEPDAFVRSFHVYKPKNGKLMAGPLWDYDIAFGSFTTVTTGWQYQQAFAMGRGTAWYMTMMRDPAFQAKILARWKTLRQAGGALSTANLTTKVNAMAATLTNAAQRNFQKWPNLGTANVGGFTTQVTQTWQQQVTLLITYLTNRSAWLDTSNWPAPTTNPWAVSGANAPGQVSPETVQNAASCANPVICLSTAAD